MNPQDNDNSLTNVRTTMNTKQAFINAAAKLLKRTPFDKITITLLCKEANLSRQTFYSYYDNIDDVIKDAYMNMFKDKCMTKMNSIDYFYSDEFLKNTIECFQRESDFFLALDRWEMLRFFSKESVDLHLSIIKSISDDSIISKYPDYFLSFIFEPVCSICLKWIKSGQKESPEELIQIIRHFAKYQNSDK